jgi:transposase-like protein
VVSRAVVVATGVNPHSDREVLGVEVGDSEDGAFSTTLLASLRARGLAGIRLVISDHHLCLKQAIGSVFVGSAWQRCRVHNMGNVLAKVPKASADMVAAAIRTIFAQPDAAHVISQMDEITYMLGVQFLDVAAMLETAKEDLLAFATFPVSHWRKIWSTNPLERVNGEIKDAPTWSVSSPTTPQFSAWSPPWSSRPTTSGRWPNAATSPRNRRRSSTPQSTLGCPSPSPLDQHRPVEHRHDRTGRATPRGGM